MTSWKNWMEAMKMRCWPLTGAWPTVVVPLKKKNRSMALHRPVRIACWRRRHELNGSWVWEVQPVYSVHSRPVWRGRDRPNLFQVTTDSAPDCRFHCYFHCYSERPSLSTRRKSSRARVRWPKRPRSRDCRRNRRVACRWNRLNSPDSRRHLPSRPLIVFQLFQNSQESVGRPLFKNQDNNNNNKKMK